METQKPSLSELMMADARASRRAAKADKDAELAKIAAFNARHAAQEAWRAVKAQNPTHGMYRVGESFEDEGILVSNGDYPEVFPMFNANR